LLQTAFNIRPFFAVELEVGEQIGAPERRGPERLATPPCRDPGMVPGA